MAGDMFRVVPLRYGGFSFAIAEAARYQFSGDTVNALFSLGTLFMVGHVLHAAVTTKTIAAIVSAIVFEFLCSAFIPTAFNRLFCRFVSDNVACSFSSSMRGWIVFASGFIIIPLMLKIIDPQVDKLINDLLVSKLK